MRTPVNRPDIHAVILAGWLFGKDLKNLCGRCASAMRVAGFREGYDAAAVYDEGRGVRRFLGRIPNAAHNGW